MTHNKQRISLSTLENIFIANQGMTNIRTTCPKCGKLTFTCTRRPDGTIIYNCYSNSCATGGMYKGKGRSLQEIRATLQGKHSRIATETGATGHEEPYRLPTYLIDGIASEEGLEWLVKVNALKAYKQGKYKIFTDPRENRLCIPLYNVDKTVVLNMFGRAWDKRTQPKGKIYNYGKQVPPFICGAGKKVIIVEDFASACNVGSVDGFVGVSLMGTNLNLTYVIKYLTQFKDCDMYVALDKDALSKAMKIRKDLSLFFNRVMVLPLHRDLKDENNIYESVLKTL